MNLTHQHVSHAYQQAATHKKKWEAYKEKFSAMTEGAVSLAEVGAGAFLGGVLEGRTKQGTYMHVPLNLGAGVALAAAGFLDLAGDWSPHLNNLGEGFIASYAASAGYAFGKKWLETGKLFAGGLPGITPAAALPAAQPSPADIAAVHAAMNQAAPAGG